MWPFSSRLTICYLICGNILGPWSIFPLHALKEEKETDNGYQRQRKRHERSKIQAVPWRMVKMWTEKFISHLFISAMKYLRQISYEGRQLTCLTVLEIHSVRSSGPVDLAILWGWRMTREEQASLVSQETGWQCPTRLLLPTVSEQAFKTTPPVT